MSDDPQFDDPQLDDAETDRPAPETNPNEVRDAPQTSSNQRQTEPIPPSPASPPPDFVPGGQHQDPDAANVTEPGLGGAAEPDQGVDEPDKGQGDATVPPGGLPGSSAVPSPGYINDEHGHIAVSTNAAQGTSEEMPAVEGIKTTSLAQPGKPDGEVAT